MTTRQKTPDSTTAALDNARWCDAVCRAHGFSGTFGPRVWTSSRRTPRFYPDAVTLDPAATPGEVLAGVDAGPGCSVKDSFASLDLALDGFEVLFEAHWIRRPAPTTTSSSWTRVLDQVNLRALGFDFPSVLFDDESVFVLGDKHGSGAIATPGESVVGLSNLVTRGDPDRAWGDAVAAFSAWFPGLPIVGYERGTELETAVRQGFEAVGPLRVWLRTG
ncbi:hypothetical protein [Amycolatopsis sp. H20-H5]|uniref:hypothetical protein n=1 Tax=Amycolatopsis sp. H20-H5 TaxID=3046309 RepID=UPI002DBE0E39|nr:hypothetical protein [Amycolatopsis sp. H20-H5]MEC3981844.1 hypothetical protein [Amycolatopsis sp. H20-H5]